MISREDLAAMRERCEKATAGPWVDGYVSGICRKEHGPSEQGPWHGKGFCKYEYEVSESDEAHQLASKSSNVQVAGNFDYDRGGIIHPKDHDFIKHARTDIPRLLAEVERLRGVAEAAKVIAKWWIRPDGKQSKSWKDADIEALHAALDQARRDRNSAVECAEVLRGYVAEGKAEIAKLRAEREATFALVKEVYDAVCIPLAWAQYGPTTDGALNVCLSGVREIHRQLAAARAALDGERELHDETQRALNLGIEFAFDAADGRPGIETACEVIAAYDARRAAEAKE